MTAALDTSPAEQTPADPFDFLHMPKSEREELERHMQRVARSAARKAPAEEPPPSVADWAHAETLAGLLEGAYRWAYHRGTWMGWTGQVWEPITEQRMATIAAESLRIEYARLLALAANKPTLKRLARLITDTCVYRHVQGGLSFLKGWSGFETEPKQWDADPWLLNVSNGLVDLRTGAIAVHSPSHLCTKLAPVAYEPIAAAPAWEAHLERFLPNESIRRQVQRDMGTALVGAVLEEALPIWYGTGGNGKTTTARVFAAVLGDYARKAAPNLLIQSRNERHSTEVADLAGSRWVVSAEIDDGKRLAEALVKDLTGGDVKKARFMRGDFFEFFQTFSITLLVNHKPIISGTDEGIWRRVRLVPWTETITDAERRPQDEVLFELLQEGPGILAWMVAGLQDWLADSRWEAPEVKMATMAYREEQDVLAPFLSDRCEIGPRYTVGVGELYDAYGRWGENVGEQCAAKRRFGDLLRQRGCSQQQVGHAKTRTWIGLRLQTDLRTDADRAALSLPGENEIKTNNARASASVRNDDADDQYYLSVADDDGEKIPF